MLTFNDNKIGPNKEKISYKIFDVKYLQDKIKNLKLYGPIY